MLATAARVAVGLSITYLMFGFLWEEVALDVSMKMKTTAKAKQSQLRSEHGGAGAQRTNPFDEEEELEVPTTSSSDSNNNQQSKLRQHEPATQQPTAQGDEEEEDDPLALANTDLVRARPRGLRLVFVGDSITRYQYLSLAYWLRYGRWFDPTTYPNNLVNAHSFHHSFHPDEDWNEFFMQSNRMLQPYELCDCARKEDYRVAIERRYFRDDARNNTLVYINISGKSTLGHDGLFGRVDPETVFARDSSFSVQQRSGLLETHDNDDIDAWEYFTWADLIQHHIGPMSLGPSAVAILNAGLHPNLFHDSLRAVALDNALRDMGLQGVWKTTTFTQTELKGSGGSGHTKLEVDTIDQSMCLTLDDCFDLSWMADMHPSWYYDQYHFDEPVYRVLNEDLLGTLGLLPQNYRRLDRSILFSEKGF